MDERLKRRLVGATVLVSLAVIFLPMLVEDPNGEDPRFEVTHIPDRPQEPAPGPVVLPLEADEPLIPPLTPQDVAAAAPPSPRPVPAPSQPQSPSSIPSKPEPEEPRVGLSAWVVQVASMGTDDAARRLAQDLKDKGFSAFVEQIYVDGRNLFRVRVGPEIDRRRAERMAETLGKDFRVNAQVLRYP